ncbi:MAG: hypothetical protein ACI33P_03960 [Lysinibacillus sp.]
MFSVVKPRAKMQELLSLNPEVSASNRFHEVLFGCRFTSSDEKKLQFLYEKCQKSKPALTEICMSYLEEIAPEGKNPYTARQVEQFIHHFFISKKDEYFVKENKRLFMALWQDQFEADRVMVILGQFTSYIMKKIMEEFDLPAIEAFEYMKAVSSSTSVVKQLLIEDVTEQMLEEVTEQLSELMDQKGSMWHTEELTEGVHNCFQSTIA